MPSLLVTARFHDGRYHGLPDWPPSPARLFQALVAASARGGMLDTGDRAALAWLEALDAPLIAAPQAREGQGFTNYVPNNDLDAVRGDPNRVNKIRVGKTIRPVLFDAAVAFLYLWGFEDEPQGRALARRICTIAEQLYQLGRGVDMAWATGEVLDAAAVDERLAGYDGVIHRPSGSDGRMLAVPLPGSIDSLILRHEAGRARFERTRSNRGETVLFKQPPKPRFRQVAYDSPSQHLLFDLLRPGGESYACRLDRIVSLTEQVRDGAIEKLRGKVKLSDAIIESAIRGRAGSDQADKAARVRITPLPSIGFRHADRAIRRVLVEIPPNCPLQRGDLEWAFNGLPIVDGSGEILAELATASDQAMLRHYAVAFEALIWRTVTPAALPVARRRIDPKRRGDEAKKGGERAEEERKAGAAVRDALRHAGIDLKPASIRVQREPLGAKGAMAEDFAPGTRFSKHLLWHVEVAFGNPVSGPVVVGDGRYLGLGLMAPARGDFADDLVLPIRKEDRPPVAQRQTVLHAVRRALMSLDAERNGRPSTLFSGHDGDSGPARSGAHRHVYIVAGSEDGITIDRIGIVAPWCVDRSWRPASRERERFDKVVRDLVLVRAGRAGVIRFSGMAEASGQDPLFAVAKEWKSNTPYRPTRHAKKHDHHAEVLVAEDVTRECVRRCLPRPDVTISRLRTGPRGGIEAEVHLRFRVAVRGPVLLGRDAHRGGGAFEAVR